MRYLAPVVLFLSLLGAEDSFITQYEYGQMLYNNPRGIGCIKCHGEKGEGSVIANYIEKGKPKTLQAPKINDLDYMSFVAPFSSKKNSIMPKYFLTKDEIQSIYFYITKKDSK